MKKIITIAFLLITTLIYAQTPESFHYQSVVRDATGNVVTNQQINFKVSILSGSITGTVEYQETFVTTTNNYGVAILSIGNGTVLSGTFSLINWGGNNFYIKIEADPTGGTNYLDMGTTQLLSVPYSLYAKNAENGFSGDYNDLTNSPTNVSQFNNDAGYLTTVPQSTFGYPELTSASFSLYPISPMNKFRGILYDSNGLPFNGICNFNVSLYDTYNSPTALWSEVQMVTCTNGYFSIEFGSENPGIDMMFTQFSELFLQININAETLSPRFKMTGTGYAAYANVAGEVDWSNVTNTPSIPSNTSDLINDSGFITNPNDADADPANELQILTRSNDTLYLTNGGFVKLSDIVWSLKGNSGTVDGTNFIGTTDNVPLIFKVNNNPSGRIDILTAGNTFLGLNSGVENTGNNFNTGIGQESLFSNTTGSYNTACGWKSLYSNTTGINNVAFGQRALSYNTTGIWNCGIGPFAIFFNTTGNYNVAVGMSSLYNNTTGSSNIAIGVQALNTNTIGSNNISIGRGSQNSSFIGNYNTTVGNGTLLNNQTGNNNCGIGYAALNYNLNGSDNVAIGYFSGYGQSGVSYNQSIFLGSNSFCTVNRTNIIMVGSNITNAECTGDNQILLGNTAITQIRSSVTGITAYSDSRYKTNVNENVKGLNFIMKLRPVTYNVNPLELHRIWGTPDSLYKNINHNDAENEIRIGFIAQDVEKAAKESGFSFPGIDIPKNNNEVYSLRYTDFIMPLVKGMQEQQVIIEDLRTQNENLQMQINELKELMLKK